MQSPLNTLLQKEMDRRDFLKHVAVGVVAMTGATTIVRTLVPNLNEQPAGFGATSQARPVANNYGYGASVYGGSANTVTATSARSL